MSTYPIINDNKPIGTLETAQDGLFTVFTARCAPVAERLRLAVFGETARAYLGLMLPETDGGDLVLRKRLTRLERSKLPDPILFAAEESFEATEPEAEVPVPPPQPDDDWRPAPDGTLRRVLSGREYAAVPAERVHVPGVPRRLLETIGGREYLVFPL